MMEKKMETTVLQLAIFGGLLRDSDMKMSPYAEIE